MASFDTDGFFAKARELQVKDAEEVDVQSDSAKWKVAQCRAFLKKAGLPETGLAEDLRKACRSLQIKILSQSDNPPDWVKRAAVAADQHKPATRQQLGAARKDYTESASAKEEEATKNKGAESDADEATMMQLGGSGITTPKVENTPTMLANKLLESATKLNRVRADNKLSSASYGSNNSTVGQAKNSTSAACTMSPSVAAPLSAKKTVSPRVINMNMLATRFITQEYIKI